MPSKIYIGTAGWSIPRAEQPRFPPGDSHLSRYAEVLPAVEINSTFHRPHRATTFEIYYSSYEDDDLATLAGKLRDLQRRRIPAWCIFDNTTLGAGTGNALSLIDR